jgi:hypothetical protein
MLLEYREPLMWATESHGRYDRSRLCYPSDLTEEEWAFFEPLITPKKCCSDKRTDNLRVVMDASFSFLSMGCQ